MSTKKVAVLLAPGFEEAEAVMVIDILHRMKIGVKMLSCQNMLELRSYHNIRMFADALLERSMDEMFDAVVIPGGLQGTLSLAANPLVVEFIRRHDDTGKLICPICSAAARVLGGNKLLKGQLYVCSGDLWKDVTDGVYVDQNVVEDGNLISGKGLGVAFDFADTIACRLIGDVEDTNFQIEHIYYDHWRVPA